MVELIKFNHDYLLCDEYPLFAQALKNPQVMKSITSKPICENDIKKAWEQVLKTNG